MFSLNETTLLSAINSGSIFSVINSTLYPSWGITYNKVDETLTGIISGTTVFEPTGWVSAEPVGDAAIVNAPIEKGSYTSYNKVRRPAELRVVFVLEGWSAYSGALPNITNFSTLSRAGLLSTLDTMKNTACTYDIETPDRVYEGYDLAHYDYSISAKAGLTLLKVSATFQQVMDIAEVSLSSNTTANSPTSNDASSVNSAILTTNGQSSVKDVTLTDVKNAWTSGNVSLSSALQTTSSAIVSGVNSAATTVGNAWTSATDQVSTQIKDGIGKFVSVVM
ncbi:phage baseplate protein [Klebsiella michiganensis]|uniref:phage baseplate protein n=1 Tax=Klebsiella michiganensis TaxID=1134687 RepID=UPI003D997CC5